jgi:RNA polymerase sigma-70 factor (ECF subfamily)
MTPPDRRAGALTALHEQRAQRSRGKNVVMAAESLQGAFAAACRGDEAAVGVVYRSLHPHLLRYLRHHVGPSAEEVASDVWLGIAGRLTDFSGTVDEFRALLFTIARRRVLDHRRRWARSVSMVPLTDDSGHEYVEFEDMTVQRLTAQGAVELLVQHLPPEQAEIVLLRVLGDLDVDEVAAITGKSKVAVRVAQHRALRRLRHVFAHTRV